jgi:hypothetical protein
LLKSIALQLERLLIMRDVNCFGGAEQAGKREPELLCTIPHGAFVHISRGPCGTKKLTFE